MFTLDNRRNTLVHDNTGD